MSWRAIDSASIITGDSTIKLYTAKNSNEQAYLRYRNDRAMTKLGDFRNPSPQNYRNKEHMLQIGNPQMRHVMTQVTISSGSGIGKILQKMETQLSCQSVTYEDAFRQTDGNNGKNIVKNLQTRAIMETHWNANEIMKHVQGEKEKQLPDYNSREPMTQASNKKHLDEQTRHHTEYAQYSNIYPTALQAGPADAIHLA